MTTPFISNLLENSPSLHTFFEAPHWHIVQGFLPLQSSALCFHGFFFCVIVGFNLYHWKSANLETLLKNENQRPSSKFLSCL